MFTYNESINNCNSMYEDVCRRLFTYHRVWKEKTNSMSSSKTLRHNRLKRHKMLWGGKCGITQKTCEVKLWICTHSTPPQILAWGYYTSERGCLCGDLRINCTSFSKTAIHHCMVFSTRAVQLKRYSWSH